MCRAVWRLGSIETAQISLVFMQASSSGTASSRLFMVSRCKTVRSLTLRPLISSGLILASKRSVTRDGQFLTDSSSTVKEQELTKPELFGRHLLHQGPHDRFVAPPARWSAVNPPMSILPISFWLILLANSSTKASPPSRDAMWRGRPAVPIEEVDV
jgi:hypothetical protein